VARRRPGARPTGRSTPRPSEPREPWGADPDRARASGRADGRRPGARPSSRRASGAGEPAADGGAAPAGESPGRTGRPRRPSGRRRAPNKATPYSTSYDPGDEEPFEPGWSGATWYGSSSGTYWTINPKEYADPRKHGPEYQRRARRPAGGWILDEETAAPEGAAGGDGSIPDPDQERDWPDGAAWAEARSAETDRATSGRPPVGRRPTFRVAPDDAAGSASATARLPRLRPPSSLTGRLAAALVAWPALGAVLASAIQESSGCGRYAASCPELSSPGTWVLNVAIIVLLIALPRLAVWMVTGAIGAFLTGLAAAVVLSAGGGTQILDVSTPILGVALIVGYASGVVYAIVLDRQDRGSPHVPWRP
jgi:hypothetical protein